MNIDQPSDFIEQITELSIREFWVSGIYERFSFRAVEVDKNIADRTRWIRPIAGKLTDIRTACFWGKRGKLGQYPNELSS
ncbi:hypothetical protein BANRA_05524 [Klebsiella pneumoniae]|nr:hypothetical protein BANRA_05524 [Klebsiella pneumoniae]